MPLLGGGLAGLIILVMSVYCVLDVITTDPRAARHLPKVMWLMVVLMVPLVGSLAWLLVGRPVPGATAEGAQPAAPQWDVRASDASAAPRRAKGGVVAPDDDPEFLDQLRRVNDEHERMLKQWEADLRKREDDLRGDDPQTGTSAP